MKGKKLLSLITAGAIATTVGVSFAAWDQLSDTATASINVANQVTANITAETLSFTGADGATNTALGAADSKLGGAMEAPFTVNITNNDPKVVDKLTFAVEDLKLADGSAVPADTVDIAVYEGANDITTTGDTTITNANDYKVKVSIKENATDANIAQVAGKTVNFTLKATAEKAAPTV